MNFNLKNSINQPIELINNKGISLHIKREDAIHPFVSGNKYRKLKYNLIEVKNIKYDGIITFGGAYSNHIIATAYAAKINDLMSIA